MNFLGLPTQVVEHTESLLLDAANLLLDVIFGAKEDFDYTPMTSPTTPPPSNSREPIGVIGASYVAGFRPCQYCGDHTSHYGLCPRVSAIEYDSYGQVKHVKFHEVRNAS